MSEFTIHPVKGIDRLLLDPSLDPDRLHLHVSEIAAGTRAHPPHTHSGVEAFYVLEGEGQVEFEDKVHPIKANEALVLNASVLHGLVNTGSGPMRYMVIITQ